MHTASRYCLSLLLLLLLQCSQASNRSETKVVHGGKEVVSFIYHRFGDHRYPSTNTSVKDFEDHLSYLKKAGFTMMTFSDAIRYLKDDSPVKKVAVITIDDGYKSFFKHGFPLLKRFKMPATLFINTKTVGGGDYMSWEDLRACMSSAIEIGNHTHSHDFFLDQAAETRYQVFEEEIEMSQTIIKKNLGVEPETFSYPYGEFDLNMKQIAKDAGFLAAAAQNSGVIYADGDLFQCPRFPMSESYSAKDKFIEKAKMKALQMKVISPDNSLIPKDGRPVLELTFDGEGLRLDQMQCFVQGGKGVIKFIDREQTKISVQASSSINARRRTLYTITVQDRDGVWHWYSHLWINPRVKG